MKSPDIISEHWKNLDKLVLVAGHAVYVGQDFVDPDKDEQWFLKNFQKGEPRSYIAHIQFGVELAASKPNGLLVFSGGQTRLEAGPRSEAQSYWILAEHFSWWQKPDVRRRSTTEEYGCDSFENLLFGIARFRECTGHYPTSIEIVSWSFKRERFDLHGRTIRWPVSDEHYKYHGVNNPADLDRSLKGEARTFEAFQADPFGTEKELSAKRVLRNPFRRQHPYAISCPEMADLLNHQTRTANVFTSRLPWHCENPTKERQR